MMSRKSLWIAVAVAAISAALLIASVDAKPRKKKYADQVSGPPTLSLSADPAVIETCGDARVQLFANARSSSRLPLRFKWTTNGGRLTGNGANTTWDLGGARPGVYHAVVEVDDGSDLNCAAFSSVAVVVTDCPPTIQPPSCPNVSVSCPDSVAEGTPVTFTASVSGGSSNASPSYNWTLSGGGHISSGQGTPSITVDTAGMAGQTIHATLDVGGYGTPCPASCSVSIPIEYKSRKFDEYYDISRNDEKARLDNYAIQLQSEPDSKGYVIVHAPQKASGNLEGARANAIRDYLVNTRGLDRSRFEIVSGSRRDTWMIELWIIPQGAKPPTER